MLCLHGTIVYLFFYISRVGMLGLIDETRIAYWLSLVVCGTVQKCDFGHNFGNRLVPLVLPKINRNHVVSLELA